MAESSIFQTCSAQFDADNQLTELLGCISDNHDKVSAAKNKCYSFIMGVCEAL